MTIFIDAVRSQSFERRPRGLLISPLTSVHVLIRKRVTSNRYVYICGDDRHASCVRLVVSQDLHSTVSGFLIGDTPVGKHLQPSTVVCGNGELWWQIRHRKKKIHPDCWFRRRWFWKCL